MCTLLDMSQNMENHHGKKRPKPDMSVCLFVLDGKEVWCQEAIVHVEVVIPRQKASRNGSETWKVLLETLRFDVSCVSCWVLHGSLLSYVMDLHGGISIIIYMGQN